MSAPTGVVPRRRVFLDAAGPNKISVIKAIREHTGMGLVEAKTAAESAPCVLAEWEDLAKVDAFRRALLEAGATLK